MNEIKAFLDSVFDMYPQTAQVQAVKRDMSANMEEKYIMLRQGGKSEQEAADSVIADFGNIDEITAELGLDHTGDAVENAISLSWDQAQAYLAMSKRNGMWIGLGVWLIIAGVSVTAFSDIDFFLFVAVAVAVAIFIVNGSKMSLYESYEKTHLRLDAATREHFENERILFVPRFNAMIAGGVAMIILSAGGFTVVDFPVPLFLNIVGFAVFLFTTAGTCHSAYDILLGRGDYAKKKAVRKSGNG